MKNLLSNKHFVLNKHTQFKYRVSILAFLSIMLLFNNDTNAQTCAYKVGTVSMSLSGQTTGLNISSQLVLTNSRGIIQYVSAPNNLTIPNVAVGNYNGIAVTYNNSLAPNLVEGSDINSVSFCNKTIPVSVGVCDCNNTTGIIAVTQTGQTNKVGQINKYVLTNGKGVILAILSTPNFLNNRNGVYNVYGVSYVGAINNLVLGELISSVNGSCLDITQGIGYVVCLLECKLKICVPFSITKIRQL